MTDKEKPFGKGMKTHLIGGILKTVCGKELEEVAYTVYRLYCNCKSCLKQTDESYPAKIKNRKPEF